MRAWAVLVSSLLLATAADAYSLSACPQFTYAQSGTSSNNGASRQIALTHPIAGREKFYVPPHPEHERLRRETEQRSATLLSQCAMVSVPQDHSNPGATTRLYCYTNPASTGLLWMLQGGPGAGSAAMEYMMKDAFESLNGAYDICTLDFRGVYRSTRLDCTATGIWTPGSPGGCSLDNEEQAPCRAELTNYNVNTYTTTQAAYDLQYLIDNYPIAKSKVAIYGTSYGTLWVYRFVQLFPTRDYVFILDSVANPLGSVEERVWLNNFDLGADKIMRQYLTDCGSDQSCSARLTADPVTFTKNVLDQVFGSDKSTCPDVAGKYTKTEFVTLLYSVFSGGYFTRPLLPALIYRLSKCRKDDVKFVDTVKEAMAAKPAQLCYNDFTDTIYYQITFTDLFEPNITRQTVLDRTADLVLNPNAGLPLYDNRQKWLATPSDYTWSGVSVATQGKFLILAGTYDSQTPPEFAQTFYENLNASKKFIGLALKSPHVVVGTTAELDQLSSPCGIAVLTAFINNEGDTAPNMDCLSTLPNVDFGGDASYNSGVLQMQDLYDGSFPLEIDEMAALIAAILLGFCTFALIIVTLALCYHMKKRGTSVAP